MIDVGGELQVVDERITLLEFADGERKAKTTVRAPIAPGLYQPIGIASHQPIQLGQTIRTQGPGTLAFDGERERTLAPGQEARLTLKRDGPHVIDVVAALQRAAALGSFSR